MGEETEPVPTTDEEMLQNLISLNEKFDGLLEIQYWLIATMFLIVGILLVTVFFIGKGDNQ